MLKNTDYDNGWNVGFRSGLLVGLVICVIAIIFSSVLFYSIANDNWQKKLVKAGYAEYYLNTNTMPPAADFRLINPK